MARHSKLKMLPVFWSNSACIIPMKCFEVAPKLRIKAIFGTAFIDSEIIKNETNRRQMMSRSGHEVTIDESSEKKILVQLANSIMTKLTRTRKLMSAAS